MGTVKTKPPVLGNALPVLGVKSKRGWYVFWWMFKIGLCSAISIKRSRRELSIDVAEHRSTLKITKIRTNPFLVSYPKHGIPKIGVCFYWVRIEGLNFSENIRISTSSLIEINWFVRCHQRGGVLEARPENSLSCHAALERSKLWSLSTF